MQARFILSLLLCACFQANAQYIVYEPGCWQELQLIITQDGGNSLRFNPRVWQGNSDSIAQGRGGAFKNYFVTDNPESSPRFVGLKKIQTVGRNRLFHRKGMFYSWQDVNIKGNSTFIVNPVLNLQAGSGFESTFNQNGRGVEVRGNIQRKVAFYSRVTENQSYFPQFVNRYRDSLGVIPGLGWWKGAGQNGGVAAAQSDYLQSVGYISAALLNDVTAKNHIVMSAGHDRFFVGQGIRSLILSNYAAPYGFVRLNTSLGPFKYQNLYGQLNGFTPLSGNTLLPKKYVAMHRGSLTFANPFQKLELGFSEMIIHNRPQGGFDLDYLNPIIFYRSAEANAGSADNALMAFDFTYSLPYRWRFYGQGLLDEFKLNKLKQGGWWGNKFGWQLGLMRILRTSGFNGLLQAEYNTVRPYTYSHSDVLNSYTHYNQPLAHPLGSNFREWSFKGFFQPKILPNLRIHALAMMAKQGNDPWLNGTNFGSNPRRDNDVRVRDDGINMFQGELSNIRSFKVDITYMVYHNVNIDLSWLYRNQTGWHPSSGNWFNLGLRWNFEPVQHLY